MFAELGKIVPPRRLIELLRQCICCIWYRAWDTDNVKNMNHSCHLWHLLICQAWRSCTGPDLDRKLPCCQSSSPAQLASHPPAWRKGRGGAKEGLVSSWRGKKRHQLLVCPPPLFSLSCPPLLTTGNQPQKSSIKKVNFRERQVLWNFTYVWNLKKQTKNPPSNHGIRDQANGYHGSNWRKVVKRHEFPVMR